MDQNEKSNSGLLDWIILGMIIVVLGVIVWPKFISNRRTSVAYACINQLGQIDAAAGQFALEHSLTNGSPIHFPDDLTPYIALNNAGKIPPCPAGGIYRIEKVGDAPTCSLGTTVIPEHVLP